MKNGQEKRGRVDDGRAAPVGIIRRFIGWFVDYALTIIVAIVGVVAALSLLVHSFVGYSGAVAANVGWSYMLRLVAHGGKVKLLGEVHTAAADEWFRFVAPLIIVLVAVPIIQFIYQWVMLAWRGCTVGKLVTNIRVRRAASGDYLSRRQAMSRAAITTATETGLIGLALVAVALAHLTVGLALWAVAVVLFWCNALLALTSRRRTLADRLTGTVVVRVTPYAQAVRRAVELVHLTADSAVVTGQLAHEGGQAIAQSAPVQRALAVSAQAKGKALEFGGLVRQRWDEQRAGRSEPDSPPAPVDPESP